MVFTILQKLWLRLLLPLVKEAITLIGLRLASMISQWGLAFVKKHARKILSKLSACVWRPSN